MFTKYKIFKLICFLLLVTNTPLLAYMKGHLDPVRLKGNTATIYGWACFKGSSRQVAVHFYAGTSRTNRKFLGHTVAKLRSEAGVKRACSSRGNHRFRYTLSSAKFEQFKGKKLWAFAIRPNKLLGKSGDREIPLPPRSDFKVKRISESEAKSESGDFDYDIKADFNNDGRLDIVRCQGTPKKTKNGPTRFHHEYESNVKVRIINGRTGKDLYSYSFEGFKRTKVFTRRIINHSCEIAYLENGRPSVIIGGEFENYYRDNKNSPKFRMAPQRIILNKGNGSFSGLVLKHGNKEFNSVTKDVRCKSFSHHRVANGAYCFFSSYPTFEDRSRPQGVTFTSLVRLRRSGNNVILNDITKKTGLLWDGVRGTNVGKFPMKHNGPHYGSRRENANVISGEFMDHNNDGLFDLFVVGQHMSFYRFNMKLDSRVDVGFKFSKTVLTSPSRSGGPTEYNKVRAFPNDFEKKCIYVSGEGKDIAGSINYVNDHIRCFSDNEWLKVEMPNNFTSNSFNAQFVESRDGNVIVRSKKRFKSHYDRNFTYFEID